VKAPYSSNGNAIDLFVPGDKILAAAASRTGTEWDNRLDHLLTTTNSLTSKNRALGGTSVATLDLERIKKLD
jgi:hypothetical protein